MLANFAPYAKPRTLDKAVTERKAKATVTENLRRLTMQERIARAAGFSMRPPVYALGHPVNDTGVGNLTRSRVEHDALADAEVVFGQFIGRVADEMRKDMCYNVRDLLLRSDGLLTATTSSTAIMLNGVPTLRSLLEKTPCEEPYAAATYLATIPSDRRAKEVNLWLQATDPKVTAVLRTRNARDTYTDESYGREIYAVVSEKYAAGHEVDMLAKYLRQMIVDGLFPYGAKGSVEYDGSKATIKALWHTDINPQDACAGEVFKAGAGITASDDRRLPIEIFAEVFRNLCLNFIIINQANQAFGTRKHIGDTSDMAMWIYETLKRASESVRGFAMLWDAGRSKPLNQDIRDLPKEFDSVSYSAEEQRAIVAGALRGQMRRGLLSMPGFRGPLAIEVLLKAYDKEPEFNRVGIVNAITRAAHEAEFTNLWAAEALEADAGKILASPKPFEFVGVEVSNG